MGEGTPGVTDGSGETIELFLVSPSFSIEAGTGSNSFEGKGVGTGSDTGTGVAETSERAGESGDEAGDGALIEGDSVADCCTGCGLIAGEGLVAGDIVDGLQPGKKRRSKTTIIKAIDQYGCAI